MVVGVTVSARHDDFVATTDGLSDFNSHFQSTKTYV